jgi:aspartyl-tRNA(Asn)/glutamyl-tRNA(Gln) amidotransferase subunit A
MTDLTRRDLGLLGGASLGALACGGVAAAATSPPSTADRLSGLTLAEASAMIHARQVTSTELVKALLERIQILNPKVNCYITVTAREALAQAAVLDAEQAGGSFRGPLHGIPIGLKDNIDTAGIRTTAASPMFKDRVPTEDADIVRRLKAAGAVMIGKLNLHEFAFGCTGDVSYFGPTRNPWALDHVTGGSSAGSGAAVAATLCYGALGTDTGGSIRVPSAWCGIVGIKPTTGLVSIRGIIPCAASLDHCGPMARTVEDVALMLGEMAGYDALDIFSVPSVKEDYVKAMRQPVSGFRLGAPASFWDHIDPEIEGIIRTARDKIAALTAGVVSNAPLWDGDTGGADGDAAFYHHELIEKYGLDYMPPDRVWIERMENPPPGSRVETPAEVARSKQRLMTTRRMIDASFKDFDLVVVPTTRMAAPKINDALKREMGSASSRGGGPRTDAKVYDFFTADSGCANTHYFDAYGVPALTVPCGFTKAGLPVGLMIAGPHFAEGKVLALAYAYEQSSLWRKKSPVLTAETPVPPIVEGAPPSEGAKPAA